MNKIKTFVLLILILAFIYFLYYTAHFFCIYPPIKEYCFQNNDTSLEETLTQKVISTKGWSIEKLDSMSRDNETSYHYNILYEEKNQKYNFNCKIELTKPLFGDSYVKLGVIGAFDDLKKTGGYKISDPDVKRLLKILENKIVNKVENNCNLETSYSAL